MIKVAMINTSGVTHTTIPINVCEFMTIDFKVKNFKLSCTISVPI